MNASSLEVLRKVLSCFIIIKLYVRRSGVRRRRCPITKRVMGWSGFSFRRHKATNRKKEREKETPRKAPTQINIKVKINEGTYAWKMHEHMTCKLKNIMGSAQSEPTNTYYCKKKTEEKVGKMKKLRLSCLGEGATLFCREWSGRNEKNSCWPFL